MDVATAKEVAKSKIRAGQKVQSRPIGAKAPPPLEDNEPAPVVNSAPAPVAEEHKEPTFITVTLEVPYKYSAALRHAAQVSEGLGELTVHGRRDPRHEFIRVEVAKLLEDILGEYGDHLALLEEAKKLRASRGRA